MAGHANESAYAVVLAGGVGKRFWPLSRKAYPKQFLRLTGDRSMLQATADRIAPLIPPERTFVVTGIEHEALVAEHLPNVPSENILAEPEGRNTAAAVAWAGMEIRERDPDATMVVLAADHHIVNPDIFRTAVTRAIDVAVTQRGLVLFGLKPDGPKTQYGYIVPEPSTLDDSHPEVKAVRRFHEKPSKNNALNYIAIGCYWNSGMFCWRIDTLLSELESHAPKVVNEVHEAYGIKGDSERFSAAYSRIPSISIDHALLENSHITYVVDSGIERIDLGTWSTVGEIWPADENGNVVRGDVLQIDADNSVQIAENVFLATIGARDLVIVVTDDVVFVCDRSRAKEAGEIVNQLEAAGLTDWV